MRKKNRAWFWDQLVSVCNARVCFWIVSSVRTLIQCLRKRRWTLNGASHLRIYVYYPSTSRMRMYLWHHISRWGWIPFTLIQSRLTHMDEISPDLPWVVYLSMKFSQKKQIYRMIWKQLIASVQNDPINKKYLIYSHVSDQSSGCHNLCDGTGGSCT